MPPRILRAVHASPLYLPCSKALARILHALHHGSLTLRVPPELSPLSLACFSPGRDPILGPACLFTWELKPQTGELTPCLQPPLLRVLSPTGAPSGAPFHPPPTLTFTTACISHLEDTPLGAILPLCPELGTCRSVGRQFTCILCHLQDTLLLWARWGEDPAPERHGYQGICSFMPLLLPIPPKGGSYVFLVSLSPASSPGSPWN